MPSAPWGGASRTSVSASSITTIGGAWSSRKSDQSMLLPSATHRAVARREMLLRTLPLPRIKARMRGHGVEIPVLLRERGCNRIDHRVAADFAFIVDDFATPLT